MKSRASTKQAHTHKVVIMATLTCRCGQVKILFPSTTNPKTHHECCCHDCRLRLTYLEEQGGPSVTISNKPMTVYTLDNKMVAQQGKDKLYLYKLSPETKLINMASTCCQTFLMARHPDYHGSGTVATAPKVSIITNISLDDDFQKPMARWFTNMWSDHELEGLEEVPHLWVTEEGGIMGNIDNFMDIFQAQNAAIQAPVPNDDKSGETFEELVKFIGSDNIVVVVSRNDKTA